MMKIANNNYLLVSHYATYAMQDLLYEYLTNSKARYVKKINFPLPELPFLKHIEIEINKSGKNFKKHTLFSVVKPGPLAYIVHVFQLFFLVLFDNKIYDVVIAENSLLTLVCLLLKKIGKINKVIFYCHGLAGNRFSKSFLNKTYGWMDDIAATHSDSNWLLSKKMIEVRKRQGVATSNIFWVPTALQLSKMKRSKSATKNSLLFLGTFNEMNGVLLLPDILLGIKKIYPEYKMDIIGDGPLKEALVKKLQQKNLLNSVTFLGVQRFDEYKSTLTTYALGLAPYKPSRDNLLNSTDPMKIRLYMAAGLPIVTTKGFPFSKEIVENDLGYTVEYTSKDYCKAILHLLSNKQSVLKMRSNLLLYSRQFDQKNVFAKPLMQVLYEKK